jgi:RNA polymerase sigma factor (sigma-70 family)
MPFSQDVENLCQELISRVVDGKDRLALDELIELHLEWAACYARKSVPRGRIEDVVHSAVLGICGAYNNSDWKFSTPGDFRKYFATALQNHAKKSLSAGHESLSAPVATDGEPETAGFHEPVDTQGPEKEARTRDRVRWTWAALEDLRPRDREVMIRYMNEISARDICSEVNVAFPNEPVQLREDSLHVKIASIKKKMDAYLRRHGITPSRLLTG